MFTKTHSQSGKWYALFLISVILCASGGCARPVADNAVAAELSQDQNNRKKAKAAPVPTPAPTGPQKKVEIQPMNFKTFTPELQGEVKAMKPGEWLPVNIHRDYLILREKGIRIPTGDYYLQLLRDPASGKVTRFLLSKKKNVSLNQVDFANGKAPDGSLAEVLDVAAQIEMTHAFPSTLAYCSASGESGSIWVHLGNSSTEWRGELFGYAGPSDKMVVTQ